MVLGRFVTQRGKHLNRLLRIRLAVALGVLFLLVAQPGSNPVSAQTRPRAVGNLNSKSVQARLSARTFPSVFQAWNRAENLPDEDELVTLVRHDLVWHVPQFYGLKWDGSPIGTAKDFSPESIEAGLAKRKELLAHNPNMILLAEIRYRDAPRDYLTEDHEWWMRDKEGKLVMGWAEGGYIRLNLKSPDFRKQVATQCRAAVKSGVVDGVMLDWWDDDSDRLALVKEVRQAIGNDALIMSNPNDRTTPRTALYINGYFMDCYRSKNTDDWRRIANTILWAETHLRSPRINCVESWFHNSRQDLNLMRAITTLVLTHSNGYCLFSDPNELPTPDHLHDWYPFWDKSLGKPTGPGRKQKDSSIRRQFEHGVVVYNPMGNKTVTITFAQARKSLATGKVAKEHSVNPADGDIFLTK